MARYYEEETLFQSAKDELLKYFSDSFVYTSAELFHKVLANTPTADVVPKSEVERLQEEVNRYKRYFFRHDYDEMIAEVLDELDRFINSNCIEIKDERGIKGYVTSGVHFAIAELKKKYTEG